MGINQSRAGSTPIEVIGFLKFFLECYGLDVSAYLPNGEEGLAFIGEKKYEL